MYYYHVCDRAKDVSASKQRVIATHGDYESARKHARDVYDMSPPDTLVEITHAGMVVWGPYVVGGTYIPIR